MMKLSCHERKYCHSMTVLPSNEQVKSHYIMIDCLKNLNKLELARQGKLLKSLHQNVNVKKDVFSDTPKSNHIMVGEKVKVQVFYSLISSLKSYHRTSHFTPCSLDLFIRVPFQLPVEHTVLQPSLSYQALIFT